MLFEDGGEYRRNKSSDSRTKKDINKKYYNSLELKW